MRSSEPPSPLHEPPADGERAAERTDAGRVAAMLSGASATPAPPVAGRLPQLAPFRVASFRFQWPSDLLTSWAFEMETLILGWYVLVETKSVLLLTVFGALQFVGTLLSPAIGMFGDRFGHRNVYCAMRATYMTLAGILTAVSFAGGLNPFVVLLIAALCGLVRPSDLAVRQTLVAETMPPEQLIGAMGIARTTSDLARIGGALAGAGLFAALGMSLAYVCVTACYAVGLLLTFGISTRTGSAQRAATAATAVKSAVPSSPLRPIGPLRQIGEGLVYVWRQPHMLAGMWLAFLVNLTAFPLSGGLLPYVAREVYQMNQTGLGMLVASFASGALVGSLALTVIGRSLHPARTTIVAAFVWYGMLLAFAQMREAPFGSACLVVAGLAQSLSMVPLATMLLRTAAPEFRGRVMGVRMLAIYSLPIGLLLAGALIPRLGFHTTATLYASIGLLFTALIAWTWRTAIWSLQSTANAR